MRTPYDVIADNVPPFVWTPRRFITVVYYAFMALLMEVIIGPALEGLPKTGKLPVVRTPRLGDAPMRRKHVL